MFYRKIIDELNAWKLRAERKPLVLRGARQVGKTTAVDIFSKEFDQYVYLNLEKNSEAEIFNRGLPIDELIQAVFLSKNISRTDGTTLIFIDEIQNSAPAVAMLRYFYEEAKDLHVIAAGSLLEALIGKKQINFPVGRVQYLFMYPLTFEEFLLAGQSEQALELYHRIPMPDFAHETMLGLFHRYSLLGGMPEIIKTYSETQDLVSLRSVYHSLLTAYQDDVQKYARNGTMVEAMRHAIESAPFEAGKRIKFHGFGNSKYRSREMGEALKTLERAMVLYLIYPSTALLPPIMPDHKKSPRLQFVDTGLVNYIVGLQEYFYKTRDLQSFYQGVLAEHIVGQELTALDMQTNWKPSFWIREKKQSNAEVDFIVPYKKYVIPVEVKAGKAGSLRSLHQYVDRADHPFAVRLYAGPIDIINSKTPGGKAYYLLNLPYFLAGKIGDYLEWFVEGRER